MRFSLLISVMVLLSPVMTRDQSAPSATPTAQLPVQSQSQAQAPSQPQNQNQNQGQPPVSPSAPGLPPGSAQAPSQGTPHTIIRRAEEVVVPVTVKDDRGALVTDLRRDEFRIFEDGIEQHINLFQQEAVPLSAVVLVDNDLPEKTVEPVQRSLETISAGFGPNDEVAVVTFDRFQKTAMGFTRSNDVVFTQLKRLQLGSSIPGSFEGPLSSGPPQINNRPVGGGAGNGDGTLPTVTVSSPDTKNIDDAIHYAGEMLRTRARDRRKLIFIISDGNNSRRNQWSFDTTLDLLLASEISVYAVVAGLNPLHLEGQRMVHYATATGGDTYTASKQPELERLYGQITEQARNQYTLGYVPQHASNNRTYHSIEVRIRRPGLKLLARQGYYTAAVR
jgi:Ca-activated chloride channel family protein